ncbi:MAG: HDIG domain-containing protein [Proteobacteria bacterium]|nr:HDIG domain-containing protein [Pseudomonadota bacterium]
MKTKNNKVTRLYDNIKEYKHYPKIIWGLVLIIVIISLNLIAPKPKNFLIRMKVGDIATKDIIAPYNFPILKDSVEIETEKAKIRESILPIIDFKGTTTAQIKNNVNNFFSLINREMYRDIPVGNKIEYIKKKSNTDFPDSIYIKLLQKGNVKIEKYFLKIISDIYEKGVINDKTNLPIGKNNKLLIKYNGSEKVVDMDEIYSLDEAMTYIRTKSGKLLNNSLFSVIEALSGHYIRPNLEFNSQETIARQNEALASIKTTKGFVSKGEMIVRAHDPVTQSVEEKLISMQKARPKNYSKELRQIKLGKNALFLLLSIIFLFTLLSFAYDLLIDESKAFIFLFSFLINIVIIYFIKGYSIFLFTLIPLSMTIGFLVDKRFAAISGIFVALLLAITFDLNFTLFIFLLIMVIISLLYIDHLHKRSGFLMILSILISSEILYVLSIEFIKFASFGEILRDIGFLSANLTISLFIVIGIVPLFEKLFHVTSSMTLIELSDLNHPLLQKLAVEAPGTYNHSLNVAIMSEAAARKIHANALLCRVGGYFHDIGKLKNPLYFVENQVNIPNPHDELAPSMSKIIIANHIKDGVALAKQYHLPREIIDIIEQHHGNSVMEGFYFKAQKANDTVTESDFRYPGPKPETREAGIICLADSIEAAIRVLKNPVPHRIEALIEQVFTNKLKDGQLNNTPLTFKDIETIKGAFLPYLLAINHKRLSYPSTKDLTDK